MNLCNHFNFILKKNYNFFELTGLLVYIVSGHDIEKESVKVNCNKTKSILFTRRRRTESDPPINCQ